MNRLPSSDADAPTLAWADHVALTPTTPEQEHKAALPTMSLLHALRAALPDPLSPVEPAEETNAATGSATGNAACRKPAAAKDMHNYGSRDEVWHAGFREGWAAAWHDDRLPRIKAAAKAVDQ